MADPNQIPHLIKLLDDESSDIRETVVKELEAYGPTLKEELKKMALQFQPSSRGRGANSHHFFPIAIAI